MPAPDNNGWNRNRELPTANQWEYRKRRAKEFLAKGGIVGLTRKVIKFGFYRIMGTRYQRIRVKISQRYCARWDRKHGVDTSGEIQSTSVDVVGSHGDRGNSIISTSPRMFAFLSQFFPANKGDFTFVDVGCGKGRVLLLAAQFGFPRVVGIEFAPVAYRTALRNLETFIDREAASKCSVVNADATEYDFPTGVPIVIYFNNPFHEAVWRKLIPRLIHVYDANRLPMHLILCGSTTDIRDAAELLNVSGRFRLRTSDESPYFLDSYNPYRYWIFDAIP